MRKRSPANMILTMDKEEERAFICICIDPLDPEFSKISLSPSVSEIDAISFTSI